MADSGPFGGDRLYTVAEVADHMRVSNMTVYRLIKAGTLPAIRVGKNYRIRGRELAAYLDASITSLGTSPGTSLGTSADQTRGISGS